MVQLIFKTHGGETIELDVEASGSVMEAAASNDIPGITADCGGSMVCGTCHVRVSPQWHAQLPKQGAMEKDMMEYVPEPQPNTRLTCQIPITEEINGIVFYIPEHQH